MQGLKYYLKCEYCGKPRCFFKEMPKEDTIVKLKNIWVNGKNPKSGDKLVCQSCKKWKNNCFMHSDILPVDLLGLDNPNIIIHKGNISDKESGCILLDKAKIIKRPFYTLELMLGEYIFFTIAGFIVWATLIMLIITK